MNSIRELWKQPQTNKNASVEWWDSLAQDFSKHEIPNSENSLTMRIIEKEGMLEPGCRVLDVGCGAGRYSVALASCGAQVFGTDISPKMIGYARTVADGGPNISFSVDDWHTLDLKEKDWNKGFDLVLANMTPAITSAETFLKLSEASRKWCVFVKPSRRENSVLDTLNEIAGATIDTQSLDLTVAYAFEMLWQDGYCPKVEYAPRVWHSKKPLDEAVFQYTKRIESYQEMKDTQKKEIKAYLTTCARDGFVEETTTATIVAMYWQV